MKILVPTWNDEFDLSDGPNLCSDSQDYFEFIMKKYETWTENPPVHIMWARLKIELFLKQKLGYRLE